MKFAFWLAYRASRFMLLLTIVLIGLSAVVPDFVSKRDGHRYQVHFGVISRVYGSRCVQFEDVLVLWLFIVPAGVSTAFFWTLSLPTPPDDACDICGYNLTGNVSGRCPECGTDVVTGCCDSVAAVAEST